MLQRMEHPMQTRLAVLIDADNISAGCAPDIFAHVSRIGLPIVRRVYGKPSVIASWIEATQSELYECRPQASVATAKNGTDIALAIDAMDIFHAGVAGTFCIVSNDRDFVPLAIRLRASGLWVHAICKQKDERYAKAFDSVLELEPRSPIVEAFRKITSAGRKELGLAEAGKLLRDVAPAGLIPAPGKGRLRKVLEGTGQFSFTGAGSATRVRLRA